jgi:hypothetical protein
MLSYHNLALPPARNDGPRQLAARSPASQAASTPVDDASIVGQAVPSSSGAMQADGEGDPTSSASSLALHTSEQHTPLEGNLPRATSTRKPPKKARGARLKSAGVLAAQHQLSRTDLPAGPLARLKPRRKKSREVDHAAEEDDDSAGEDDDEAPRSHNGWALANPVDEITHRHGLGFPRPDRDADSDFAAEPSRDVANGMPPPPRSFNTLKRRKKLRPRTTGTPRDSPTLTGEDSEAAPGLEAKSPTPSTHLPDDPPPRRHR